MMFLLKTIAKLNAISKARDNTITADSHDWWMNATDSSDQTSPTGSWIDYWEKVTDLDASYCSVKGCDDKAEHGAHVWQKKGGPQYIVPMCAHHNEQKKKGRFHLEDGTPLVPVPSDRK